MSLPCPLAICSIPQANVSVASTNLQDFSQGTLSGRSASLAVTAVGRLLAVDNLLISPLTVEIAFDSVALLAEVPIIATPEELDKVLAADRESSDVGLRQTFATKGISHLVEQGDAVVHQQHHCLLDGSFRLLIEALYEGFESFLPQLPRLVPFTQFFGLLAIFSEGLKICWKLWAFGS